MSSNRQQNTMCTICCKFKWNSSLKLHISLKHNKPSITLLHEKERQHHGNLMLDSQHNNEPIAEGSKVEELEDSLLTYNANLTSESVDHLTPLTLIYDSVTLPIMCKCMYRNSSRTSTH